MSAQVGAVLILAAMLINFRAQRALRKVGVVPGKGFIKLQAPTQYVTHGVYRLKHPMYLSVLMFFSGAGMIALGWGGFVLALPAIPFYVERIWREEALKRLLDMENIVH